MFNILSPGIKVQQVNVFQSFFTRKDLVSRMPGMVICERSMDAIALETSRGITRKGFCQFTIFRIGSGSNFVLRNLFV